LTNLTISRCLLTSAEISIIMQQSDMIWVFVV